MRAGSWALGVFTLALSIPGSPTVQAAPPAVRAQPYDYCAVPVARGERLIQRPRWARVPPVKFPDPGGRDTAGDCALVRCRVAWGGRLTDCQVLAESPPGAGMGKLVIFVAEHQRLLPRDRDGRKVLGRWVRFSAHIGAR